MYNITRESVQHCAMQLGQFDDERICNLVTLFHHQDACWKFTVVPDDLRSKFENLLTIKSNDDKYSYDIPTTKIELALMIHFKENYLYESTIDTINSSLISCKKELIISDELNLAYCFLLAQIDDSLPMDMLTHLKFLFNIRETIACLFDIYKSSGDNCSQFFSMLLQCKYLKENLVHVEKTIRNFQIFVQKYEDFLVTFAEYYKELISRENNHSPINDLINHNDFQYISSFSAKSQSSNHERLETKISSSVEQNEQESQSRTFQQISTVPSSARIPKKGLCVIININMFAPSHSFNMTSRHGSEKDVGLIKVIFNRLKFTILECQFNFTKADLDSALSRINDANAFENFDCLVIFFMTHGFLHSLMTADVQEIKIRDIIKLFADSSITTIWNGKPRLFFIQACRSSGLKNEPQASSDEIKLNDLSSNMLVAYSCGPYQESKRSPTIGSLFIQVLCIMLLKYSHSLNVQEILYWTRKFVITHDEHFRHYFNKNTTIQTPEYIERDFFPNFRFSTCSLIDTSQSWTYEARASLQVPWSIWNELYELLCHKTRHNQS